MPTAPLVSILLPNLNNRAFLDERLDSIRAQSLPDWELVVVDNHSEDGAWELFQRVTQHEPRMRISQAPREGMYANWNNCLRKARGRYVYIATSDDTMADDCLEQLVDALETHPDCDLAHCRLRVIDKQGRETEEWWSKTSIFARSSGEWLHRRHTRRAPYDGLLHLSGESVYISITQLLIRRQLFDRIGLFEPRWGSVGDFNWSMRASLVADTIHVPETWGGWRVHAEQATAAASLSSGEHCGKVDDMIAHAIRAAGPFLTDAVRRELEAGWESYAREMRRNTWALRNCRGVLGRRWLLLRGLLLGSPAAREHVKARLRRLPRWPDDVPLFVGRWLESAGAPPQMLAA